MAKTLRRRAGLPVASVLVGVVLGVAVAWAEHELGAFHRQQRFARCFFCNDFLVDMTDAFPRSRMVAHLTRCPSYPMQGVAAHIARCRLGIDVDRLAS